MYQACQRDGPFLLYSVMIDITMLGGAMLRKLSHRIYLLVFLSLTLSGCSAIRGIGDALTNGIKGFSIHFP